VVLSIGEVGISPTVTFDSRGEVKVESSRPVLLYAQGRYACVSPDEFVGRVEFRGAEPVRALD
jgi:hypothetical protein